MSESTKKFFGNWIVKNLLLAIAFILALVILLNFLLGIITHHSQTIEVPDFTNMQVSQAAQVASKSGLHVAVEDSVYVRRMAPGAVFSQNPKPGSAVKDGRLVRLHINSVLPKKVTMPDLVGLSLRQAKAELSSKGLYLGKITYVEDLATNVVIRQVYRNSEIRKGRSVESGATIDLVVGLNDTEYMTNVPNVKGQRYLQAVDAIQSSSLNVGKLKFASSVKTYADTLNAVVTSQSPSPDSPACRMGSEVSLTLSVEQAK